MNSPTHCGTLRVLEDACQFAPDRSRATIVLESTNAVFPDAIEELGAKAARELALSYAATQGVPDPRINGMTSGAYPVNCDGKSLDQVAGPGAEPLPANHRLMQPSRYRIAIPVTRKLV